MKKIKKIIQVLTLVILTFAAIGLTSCSCTNPPENQTLFEEFGKLGIECDHNDGECDNCKK